MEKNNADNAKLALCYVPLLAFILHFVAENKTKQLEKHIRYGMVIFGIYVICVLLLAWIFKWIVLLAYLVVSWILGYKAYIWEPMELTFIDDFFAGQGKTTDSTPTQNTTQTPSDNQTQTTGSAFPEVVNNKEEGTVVTAPVVEEKTEEKVEESTDFPEIVEDNVQQKQEIQPEVKEEQTQQVETTQENQEQKKKDDDILNF